MAGNFDVRISLQCLTDGLSRTAPNFPTEIHVSRDFSDGDTRDGFVNAFFKNGWLAVSCRSHRSTKKRSNRVSSSNAPYWIVKIKKPLELKWERLAATRHSEFECSQLIWSIENDRFTGIQIKGLGSPRSDFIDEGLGKRAFLP